MIHNLAPRWKRLLQWLTRYKSPSIGNRPMTFKEAWTGDVRWEDVPALKFGHDLRQAMLDGLKDGLKDQRGVIDDGQESTED